VDVLVVVEVDVADDVLVVVALLLVVELLVVVVLDVLVLVRVEELVVETDVVAEDVRVDVCVVDGDVNSQFRNEPSIWRATSSLSASVSSCTRDSPVAIISSACPTASMTCTNPAGSRRQPSSKKVPL